MQEAERIYDELLQTTPQMTDSWYLRSALRRAKPEKNTVEGAEHRLKDLKVGLPATIPVHYALAREFEDLGSLDRAFEHLRQGAAARRKILSYNVQSDVQTMSSIAKIFSADWAETALQGACKETPVFILGLPRSGTTLVDRILSSHSQVSSLGEVNDLAYGVIRLSGPAASKSNLLEQAANLDLNKLGHDYMKALRGYGATEPYLIDKTPANFLYLGLIMQALPNAKIVHLSRHPMASGYAMFKTLFRMGYPFSYDQQDLGRYISAYLRLMDHWYDLYPDRIHRVQYETLVTQQEVETRRLLDACGLEWESASLNFQDNSAPTATASASQVREPIHTRSVEQWKALRSGLLPLEETLRREGIAL